MSLTRLLVLLGRIASFLQLFELIHELLQQHCYLLGRHFGRSNRLSRIVYEIVDLFGHF